MPPTMTSDDLFKRAYMYYEKNENARALAIILKSDQNEVRFKELKAQLLYRLGKFDECLALFNEIVASNHSDDFDELRRANIVAVHAMMCAQKRQNDPDTIDTTTNLPFEPETFEQIYNAACFQIGQGNFNDAIKLLDKSIVEARDTLTAEGFQEDEIQKELSVILAQKAYAFQKLGLCDDALKIYKSIDESNASDKNTKAVIINNILVMEKVPADMTKLKTVRCKLKNISEKGSWKLNILQKRTVFSNLEVLQPKSLLAAASAAAGKDEIFQEIVTGKLDKRNRKRKPRLPKNYDPNVAPDPERWLPRQERSAYKKKLNRKYKDRDIGRGTQGSSAVAAIAAAVTTNSNIDFTKQGASSVEQSPKPTEGPRQQRPGAPKKPKKKKGGRW